MKQRRQNQGKPSRQQWAKVLEKPAVKREVKPLQKVGLFSLFFKVV